jgi:hypothetical protein
MTANTNTELAQRIAELPPLPKPAIKSYQIDSVMRVCDLETYATAQMHSYALAAQAPLIERIAELERQNAQLLLALQQVTDRFYWLVELRPAFDGHPAFPPTYYAGWMDSPLEAAKTQDVYATPRFTRKDDAERVAKQLGHTLSCVWQAVEHGFHDNTPTAANAGGLYVATAADWSEDFPHENGNYENRCSECGIGFMGHKRRVVCKICSGRPTVTAATNQEGQQK